MPSEWSLTLVPFVFVEMRGLKVHTDIRVLTYPYIINIKERQVVLTTSISLLRSQV